MQVVKVSDRSTERLFYGFPARFYREDPEWVVVPGHIVDSVFNPRKNSFFRNGAACRWLLLNDYGRPAGRIAAFYNKARPGYNRYGRIGFFECIEEEIAATALFNTARKWLAEKGYATMEGPVNFGEKDRFWGLLTEGFTEPVFLDNYNPPYYTKLFKNYGFQPHETIYTFEASLSKINTERLKPYYNKWIKDTRLSFRHIKLDDYQTFLTDLHQVYTAAFKKGGRFDHLTLNDLHYMVANHKPYMREELIWMAYVQEEPVAFLAFFPEMNEQLKKRLQRKNGNIQRIKGFAFAVKPKWQQSGIHAALVQHFFEVLQADTHYKKVCISGIFAKTTSMIKFLQSLNFKRTKTHQTFIYKTKAS